MIRRWEKDAGGVSERYRLHYCQAFKIPFKQFGTSPVAPPSAASNGVQVQASAVPSGPGPADGEPGQPPGTLPGHAGSVRESMAAGSREKAGTVAAAGAGVSLAVQVQLTAHQGNEHAQRAERRDIGEASMEHLGSEVTRLSAEYMTGEPLSLFFEMRRVRDQLYTALDRHLWPRDEMELYLLLGILSSLMADTAGALGNPAAAQELARSGLAYGLAIGDRPLIAQLRLSLAAAAWWAGQPRRCLEVARSGLDYLSSCATGTQLHLMCARTAARLGDADTAMGEIAAAQDGDLSPAQDLLEIGGQFGLSRACLHYLAGSALTELPGAGSEAIAQLGQAVQLYAAGPEPGEDHSQHCQNLARIDLATAWLDAGDLDAAATTTGPVLALSSSRRIASLPQRLARLRAELAAPRYRAIPQASELDEQIEQLCRDTITTRLCQAGHPC